MFLPRLARALDHPMVATTLGGVLIVLGAIAIATGEPLGWWILIIVVGVINVLRGVLPAGARESDPGGDGGEAPGRGPHPPVT